MLHRLPIVLALVALIAPPGIARAIEPADRLIVEPEGETLVRIEGHYPQAPGVCPFKQRRPLLARYRGRLAIERTDDGRLRIVNSLSFSQYLRGLAEVPAHWPAAALRAQAIAARSYALATMRDERERADARGYDICATDQCQVYRGATIELGAYGERWARAVERTRGQVLTRQGDVVKTFYFSTSSGSTRKSFASRTEGPSYLDNVPGEDGDAPLARWRARIRLADLDDILRARGTWSGGRITAVTLEGDTVRISGGGTTAAMPRTEFRVALNNEAPCQFPSRYPSKTGSQTGGALPQTVPSAAFSLRSDRGTIVLTGRGWGHDVGMSQWGARSLAERGRSTRQILEHYYNAGLTRIEEPAAIRVLAAEGLRRVVLRVEGDAVVRTGTGSRLSGGAFDVRGGDGLSIRRSRGPRLRSILSVEPTARALRAGIGDAVRIPFETSRSARIRVEVIAGDDVVLRTPERSFVSGEHEVSTELVGQDGRPLPAGEYRAIVVAFDGLDRIRSSPVSLVVEPAAVASRGPAPTGGRGGGSAGLPIAIAVVLAAAAGGAVLLRRRARHPNVNV